MTCQKDSQPSHIALDRLMRRVGETIAQCHRFEKMAAVATAWAHTWPTSTLERWLNAEDSSQLDCEIALIALALTA